jgi:hypothetical protein
MTQDQSSASLVEPEGQSLITAPPIVRYFDGVGN